MSRYLQLLHPYMPHITEELSARMAYVAEGEFLMQKVYPAQPLSPVTTKRHPIMLTPFMLPPAGCVT